MSRDGGRAALEQDAAAVSVGAIGADAPEWDPYVRATAGGTFCHLAGWARAVERAWRHTPHHLCARRGGRLVGLLPLVHVRSPLFGASLVSTPNAVYGGAIADDDDARRALVTEAKAIAHRLNVRFLELRDSGEDRADADLARRELYVTFDRPIGPDEDALAKSLPRDIRRMIRQGPKHRLSSCFGREELLDAFYEVYATSVRNLGTPVFPKRLFANLLEEFPGACDILLIRQGARVAGGVMSFYFRDAVFPYYGGALPEFYRAGVSNFMYWELMRSAAVRGCRRFDFGRSKLGTGACAFKRGWGMTERPLRYGYYLVSARSLPDLTPANPAFEPFIRLWKRMPLPLSRLVGPVIARGLP